MRPCDGRSRDRSGATVRRPAARCSAHECPREWPTARSPSVATGPGWHRTCVFGDLAVVRAVVGAAGVTDAAVFGAAHGAAAAVAVTVTALGAAATGRAVVGDLLGRGRRRDDLARLLANVAGGIVGALAGLRADRGGERGERGGCEEGLREAVLHDVSLAVRGGCAGVVAMSTRSATAGPDDKRTFVRAVVAPSDGPAVRPRAGPAAMRVAGCREGRRARR